MYTHMQCEKWQATTVFQDLCFAIMIAWILVYLLIVPELINGQCKREGTA
jgi:hypothetical protein